jgi:tellurite resistance protein TerC
VGRVALWVAIAVACGAWVVITQGASTGAEYFAAYLLELSLSADNIFVFVIAFSALRIPVHYQRRVLGWGIAGALVFRAGMIGGGIALVQRFDWTRDLFAALVLLAAWRTLFTARREHRLVEDACRACSTWIARVIPVSPVLDAPHFWRCQRGRLVATPLFVALVLIETTDIVFALDSVPAVLAITRNPLVVYSSNILAMLALRSLYFVVADAVDGLRYLPQGIAIILVFTGAKMIAGDRLAIGPGVSVAMIGVVLCATVVASRRRGAPAPRIGGSGGPEIRKSGAQRIQQPGIRRPGNLAVAARTECCNQK